MDNTVISIQDAVVSYREDVALQGVSLEVKKGEFIGIIGPNGAGKTTLLTVVNGLGKLIHGQAWPAHGSQWSGQTDPRPGLGTRVAAEREKWQ
jgi:ABC-type Mn2+/Zn2+ transport system ATPase subunit